MAQSEAISFSLPGWKEIAPDDNARAAGVLREWGNDEGGQLCVFRFDKEPDLVAPLSDMDALRGYYRHMMADRNGAIVSVDCVDVAGLPALRAVFKVKQDPHGMTYIGSYTFPFDTFSYVIRIICPEIGTTGLRDAMVADKCGWTVDGPDPQFQQDPYDPNFKASVLRNKSDDEEWDELFPEHPLSRIRAALKSIAASCRVGDELRNGRPFTGPSTIRKKESWWRRLTMRSRRRS